MTAVKPSLPRKCIGAAFIGWGAIIGHDPRRVAAGGWSAHIGMDRGGHEAVSYIGSVVSHLFSVVVARRENPGIWSSPDQARPAAQGDG